MLLMKWCRLSLAAMLLVACNGENPPDENASSREIETRSDARQSYVFVYWTVENGTLRYVSATTDDRIHATAVGRKRPAALRLEQAEVAKLENLIEADTTITMLESAWKASSSGSGRLRVLPKGVSVHTSAATGISSFQLYRRNTDSRRTTATAMEKGGKPTAIRIEIEKRVGTRWQPWAEIARSYGANGELVSVGLTLFDSSAIRTQVVGSL